MQGFEAFFMSLPNVYCKLLWQKVFFLKESKKTDN